MNGYGNYSDNPYGQNYATGGGSGGGFMAGGGSQDSPSGKKAGAQTLRPVTIRQILDASQPHPDAEFSLDGAELGQLTFVAAVRNVSRNVTSVSFSMEDGTGQIEVRQFLDSQSDDSGKTVEIEQNMYVRVLGSIKSFQNRRSVTAGHLRPVTDHNEVLYHKLEAVYVHLQMTNGSIGGGGTLANQGQEQRQAAGVSAYNASNTGGGGRGDEYADLTPMRRQIMQVIVAQAPNVPDDGVHVDAVARQIQGASRQMVVEEIEYLTGEGFLYSAMDDSHVLPVT